MLRNGRSILTVLVLGAYLTLTGACVHREQEDPCSAERLTAAAAALEWLRTEQADDGSYSTDFGHPAGITCDVLLAVAASGGDPSTWRISPDKPSIADYIASTGPEYATDAASTAKMIVALAAAGLDPRDSGSQDFLARLESLSDGTGTYDPGAVGQAWSILALVAAQDEQAPAAALAVLKGYQLESGAWPAGWGPENDTTCLALQALIAAGEPKDSESVQQALAFLKQQQNEDGGFPTIKPSDWGTDTNANSTASVIMALAALGDDPVGPGWTKADANPLTALLDLQAEDGKIEFQRGVGSPLMATTQATLALLGKALPLHTGK